METSFKRLLPLLLLLTPPAVVQAQFNYTNNGDGTATITGYYGSGGAVTIPSTINGLSVTSIGDWAFCECMSLTGVTIGTNVSRIGDGAFADCTGLTGITIPNSVISIGEEAFEDCASLTAITVDALNSFYSSLAGVLFNSSRTALIQCPAGKAGRYTIPDSVTSIGYEAFYECTSLTSVTIPNSVTSIGDRAFVACTGLTSVTIPDSVTNIVQEAFEYCTSLTSVTIPTGVTSIGSYAFSGSGLTSLAIPNSVTSIGQEAFEDCTSLTSVTIPDSVTNIGDYPFIACSSLTAIKVDALNSFYSSVDGVLFDKSQTMLIEYAGGKAGSYTIPNSVTSIGDYAFSWCTNLTSVTIPNSVTSIGGGAFLNCGSLANVTIPNSVFSIGDHAFCECTSLTSVAISAGVTSIGSYAFSGSGLTSLTIPNSVTSIGEEAFEDCTSLTSVTIPNSVFSISDYAFYECTGLTNLTISTGVTNIGWEAFGYCSSLTSITIPNSVTNIGGFAFGDCTSLTGVYFQGDAPSLGSPYVFSGANKAIVYYLAGTKGWGATYGGRPTAVWRIPPAIQRSPQTQTAEAGSAVALWVQANGSSPLCCLWYLNYTNFISSSTNWELELTNLQFSRLELTNVQFAQSGTYTAVVTNGAGAITSSPAMLNVIAAIERRPVPGVKVTGEAGSLLNVDSASSLSPAPNWTMLGSVSLTSTSQYCFDLTLPLPPQRFYRAWQTGTLGVIPSVELHLVPAITLTGNIGDSWRLDYINRFGPIDAWVTLETVTLTNTSQLYFDTSTISQPARLYRLAQVP